MQKLSKFIAPILTFIIFGIIVIVMFSVFKFTNNLNNDFWTTTLLGTVLTILTTLVWFPVGIENGKKQENFMAVSKQYNKRAEYIVNNQLISDCNTFCDVENEKFALKLLKERLGKYCIGLDFFYKYKDYSYGKIENEEAVKHVEKELTKLSKKQLRVLKKLKDHEIKFTPLTTSAILKMKVTKGRISPVNQEKRYKTLLWTGKVLWSICSFAILAFITVSPNTDGWLGKVFQLLVWIIMVGYNIYASLNNGAKSITEYRKNDILQLSTKCAQFFEWKGIKLLDVDKETEYEAEDIEIGKE